MLLDFGDRTRTGIFNMVWLLAVFYNVVVIMKFILMKYLMLRLREMTQTIDSDMMGLKRVETRTTCHMMVLVSDNSK